MSASFSSSELSQQHVFEEDEEVLMDQEEPEAPWIHQNQTKHSKNENLEQMMQQLNAQNLVVLQLDKILGGSETGTVGSEEEMDVQSRLQDISWKPGVTSDRMVQQHVPAEQQLWNQVGNTSLDQEEAELPQIKEELVELCCSGEGEQLVLKQETVTFHITTLLSEKEMDLQLRHLKTIRMPEIKLHRIDLQQQQEEPEPPQIKEQQEEPEPLQIKEEQEEPEPLQIKEQEESEPPQIKEEQEEAEPPQIKEEQEEPEPLQIKEEQEEPEPLQIKEQEESEPPQIKEEQEEAEPLQIKEEQEEPEPLQIKEEQEEPELPQIKEAQEEPEPPQIKEEQEEPELPQIKQDQEELCSSQVGEQLVLKQKTGTFMETCEESDDSEPEPNSHQLLLYVCPVSESPNQKKCKHVELESAGITELNLIHDEDRQSRTKSDTESPKCDICGKTFRDKYNLKRHQTTHTGLKPHVCETCGKSYTQKGFLISHMRTHTDERSRVCGTCGKCFSQISYLIIHMKTHTGEKPYSCKICGKRFSHNSDLINHDATHTGLNLHVCGTCGKCFSQKGYLISHMRTHTDKNLAEKKSEQF